MDEVQLMSGLALLIVGAVAFTLFCVLCVVMWRRARNDDPYSGATVGWAIGSILAGLAALALLLVAVIVPVEASYDETECRKWGESSDREVRFERWSSFSWSCFVNTEDGWVSKDSIVKVED
jgi:hypothetical protein